MDNKQFVKELKEELRDSASADSPALEMGFFLTQAHAVLVEMTWDSFLKEVKARGDAKKTEKMLRETMDNFAAHIIKSLRSKYFDYVDEKHGK